MSEEQSYLAYPLADVCELITDGTHHSPPNGPSGAFRYVTAKNIKKGRLDLSDTSFVTESVHREIYARCPAQPGDVLYIKDGATTGLAAINTIPEPISLLSSVALLRPIRDLLDPYFLCHWLNSPLVFRRLTGEMTGTAIKRIVLRDLRSAEIELPPLPVQRRIVAKLDALQSRTRLAREALAAIPALLNHYRQSVLAAAFRGELTADWRQANPSDSKEAQTTIESMRLKRENGWYRRGPYTPPSEPALDEVPEIPASWQWTTWDLISSWITYGFTRPMPHKEAGIPIVTAKNVSGGRLDLDHVHLTPEAEFAALSDKDRPEPGDLLVTKDGAIGRAALVPNGVRFCINQSVAVVQLRHCLIDREYLLYLVQAPMTQVPILELAKGMAIQHLSITDFAKLPVPVPPLGEQREIVRKLNSTFQFLDGIATAIPQALQAVDHLDQSLLATAFRGELVPQDPSDEPASDLLDRIRAIRAEAGDIPRRSRGQNPPAPSRPLAKAVKANGDPYSSLLGALRRHGSIASSDAQAATGLDAASVRPLLQRLVAEGTARVEGQKRGTRYVAT